MKRLAFILLIISAFTIPAIAKYSGGSGEPTDPYQIADVNDLLTLANDINDYNKCFIMTADIDLDPCLPGNKTFNLAVIAPVIYVPPVFEGVAFSGTFNGTGHKILNMTIEANNPWNDSIGFIGRVFKGEVKNIGIEDVRIICDNNSYSIGGLVGLSSEGLIKNCYSTGIITCGNNINFAGGLMGYNVGGGWGGGLDSIIINCYSSCSVTAGNNSSYIGGLNGYNQNSGGQIINCYSTGGVNAGLNSHYIGGLTGSSSSGSISYSYFLDTAGPDNGYGEPLTDEQMKQQASFVGWDFVWEMANGPNDVWAICEGVDYPKLAWQYVVGDSDNDKDVDFTDFALMGEKWRQADSTLYCGGTDLTGDGWVDLDDLAALADNWLIEL